MLVFQEKLKRDNYVFKMNKKNKISDYEKFYSNKNIQILNVEKIISLFLNPIT